MASPVFLLPCALFDFPTIPATLTKADFLILDFRLFRTRGLFPHEIRHTESTNGGHASGEVIHVTAETNAALFRFRRYLLHRNRYIFAPTFRTDHIKALRSI